VADNVDTKTASNVPVASDVVTYSGDPDQNVQLMRPVLVTGTEGSKTVIDLPGDARNGLDVDVVRLPPQMVDTFGKLMAASSINDIDVQFWRDVPANLVTISGTGGTASAEQVRSNIVRRLFDLLDQPRQQDAKIAAKQVEYHRAVLAEVDTRGRDLGDELEVLRCLERTADEQGEAIALGQPGIGRSEVLGEHEHRRKRTPRDAAEEHQQREHDRVAPDAAALLISRAIHACVTQSSLT
jgi:hypothetical protein